MAGELEQFIFEATGKSHFRVEQDLGSGFVRLEISEAERRQALQDIRSSEDIVLELLRNSRDAHARHIFLAVGREENTRKFTIIDDGDGIPEAMHKTVFEPRVTSKLETSHIDKWGYHGRGMALYSISTNAKTAEVLLSAPALGTSIAVQTDLLSLPEKKDQSTFPRFEQSNDGTINVRGPRNIVRTACEFAIEARSDCSIFFGSATEIAAALYVFGKDFFSEIDRSSSSIKKDIPIAWRVATAKTPEEFAQIAAETGLEMSSRSARRIMDGEIAPAEALLSQIKISNPQNDAATTDKPHVSSKGAKARPQQTRPINISADDRAFLNDSLMFAFNELARRYYLEDDVAPSIQVAQDALRITIPLIPKQD